MVSFPPLIYYLNIDQPLVGREISNKIVHSKSNGYKYAFETIDNRISIAAQARDWLFFKLFNPSIIEIIKRNEIQINTSLFSHTRIDLIPNSFNKLFKYSEQTLKLIFGNDFEKILIFPEHVIPSEFDDNMIKNYFFIYFTSNLKDNQLQSSGLVNIGKNNKFKGIVTSSTLQKGILHYYREAEMFENLIEKQHNDNLIFNTTVEDFERPFTYKTFLKSNLLKQNRFDLWVKLHKKMNLENIASLNANDILLFTANNNSTNAEIYPSKDYFKWISDKTKWLINLQNEVYSKFDNLGNYFEVASLFCLSYDAINALSKFFEQDEFCSHIKDQPCEVDFVRDLTIVHEQSFMIRNLLSNKPLSYRAFHLPTQSRNFVENLEKCVKFLENKLY